MPSTGSARRTKVRDAAVRYLTTVLRDLEQVTPPVPG
jgi:hypothetical protein